MSPFTLRLEGHADQEVANADQVKRAVQMMAEPQGPTYIVLTNPQGGYAQAAGFNDCYRIECRDVYGEGFRHWLAASPTIKDRSDVVMYFRNRCDIHGTRRCPLPAWGENVLALSDVLAIVLSYQATGERLDKYPWEDVSQSFLDKALEGDAKCIKTIQPRRREEP